MIDEIKQAIAALDNELETDTWRIAHASQILRETIATPEQSSAVAQSLTDERQGLIARLRDPQALEHWKDRIGLIRDAADTLEADAREIARLQAELDRVCVLQANDRRRIDAIAQERDAAQAEIARLSAQVADWTKAYQAAYREATAATVKSFKLQAELDGLKQQEPAATVIEMSRGCLPSYEISKQLDAGTELYLAAGAQHVPEGLQLVHDTMTTDLLNDKVARLQRDCNKYLSNIVELTTKVTALQGGMAALKQQEPAGYFVPKTYDGLGRVMTWAQTHDVKQTPMYLAAGAQQVAVPQESRYTTGHCKNHSQPGGCQLHNVQCGYPACDRKAAPQPPQGE